MKTRFLIFVTIIGFTIGGCASRHATLKTFIDPTVASISIKTVAVFSMRNTAFSPGETMEFDRKTTEGFIQKNPSLTMIGTTKSIELINQENLAPDFAKFLEDFELSGIPNVVFLNKLRSKFNIDAILQGRLTDVKQNDAERGAHAQASLTVRYTLLNTSNGRILWEGTSHAVVEYGKTKGRFAPPFYEVATIAQNKLLKSLPALNQ